ncbi:MAG: hypothetical protein WDM78_06475 [Puia sp.]
MIRIHNGHIITPERIISNGSLLIRDDRIVEVTDHDPDIPGEIRLDAGGGYISPGFIDIHVHGGGGYDFMDNSVEAFLEIARLHARYGTTTMYPTTLAGSTADIIKSLETFDLAVPLNESGAQLMGMHLEGPLFRNESTRRSGSKVYPQSRSQRI